MAEQQSRREATQPDSSALEGRPASEINLEALAQLVYRLMREEARIERERDGRT
jgi:hypothetical protein